MAKVEHPNANLAHAALNEVVSYIVALVNKQATGNMEGRAALQKPVVHLWVGNRSVQRVGNWALTGPVARGWKGKMNMWP